MKLIGGAVSRDQLQSRPKRKPMKPRIRLKFHLMACTPHTEPDCLEVQHRRMRGHVVGLKGLAIKLPRRGLGLCEQPAVEPPLSSQFPISLGSKTSHHLLKILLHQLGVSAALKGHHPLKHALPKSPLSPDTCLEAKVLSEEPQRSPGRHHFDGAGGIKWPIGLMLEPDLAVRGDNRQGKRVRRQTRCSEQTHGSLVLRKGGWLSGGEQACSTNNKC